MLVEAIEKILSLSGPKTVMLKDLVYSTQKLVPVEPPKVVPLKVHTLSGFCDYVNCGEVGTAYVLVEDHCTVTGLSRLDPSHMSRQSFIVAKAPNFDFNFGQWYDLESFIISLQAFFAPSKQRDLVLSAVSGLKMTKGLLIRDDGVGQTVQTESGVSRVENTRLPNPITLKPFRTFLEVDQPESEFVFRIKETDGGAACKLVEADGGAWKVAAMERISMLLSDRITESGIVLLA